MNNKIIIGSRGSKLALIYAQIAKDKILQTSNLNDEDVIIKEIITKGDQVHDIRLSEVGGKGLFTKNIEKELLEKKIDLKFKNKDLLVQALTHKSFNPNENNEKIEFLGDRVLGLVIAKKLLEIYPGEKEGILDKKFASLVNKKTCLDIAKKINLDTYVKTFNPNNKKIKIEDKIISDSCEALIGAIYLDKGFTIVEKTILNLWQDHIEKSVVTEIDAKTKLQELTLKNFKKLPTYKLVSNTGPRHKPIFKVGVKLPNTKYFIATGKSKKEAEQNAAIECLKNTNKK